MRVCLPLALAVLSVTACRDKAAPVELAAPTPSVASAVTASRVASAPPAAPPTNTIEPASYSGSYEATAHHVDVPIARGGLPEWAADDGRRGVGKGTLDLAVRPDGTVEGVAHGPFGDQAVTGVLEGDTVTARLVGKTPESYAGTLILHREGNRITGSLQASSADGRVSRSGTVALVQKTP